MTRFKERSTGALVNFVLLGYQSAKQKATPTILTSFGSGCRICSIEGDRDPDVVGVMAPRPPALRISPACSRCSSVNLSTPEISCKISNRFWSPLGMFKKLINRFEIRGLMDPKEKLSEVIAENKSMSVQTNTRVVSLHIDGVLAVLFFESTHGFG